MKRFVFTLGIALLATGGCNSDQPAGGIGDKGPLGGQPRLTFMTNGVAYFWTIAEAGAKQAGKDFGADVTVTMPSSITDQTRKLEDLLTRGCDGIAISPVDPENQSDVINQAAATTNLITQDSDAPESNRLFYIGMDNYLAGKMCGELVRKTLPDGGTVMLFIGRLDQDNAQRRRQGCLDAIVGLEPDPSRRSPSGETLVSDDGKYRVLGTLTDNFDRAKAKANAEDTLTRHPDVTAMVGLFVYNPPAIVEALERAGKLKSVQVIGFDEDDVTLQGIKDGTVAGTVVQDPYNYGYESIRLLKELADGNQDVIPESGFIDFPARVIDASNVDEFWNDLKEKLSTE